MLLEFISNTEQGEAEKLTSESITVWDEPMQEESAFGGPCFSAFLHTHRLLHAYNSTSLP